MNNAILQLIEKANATRKMVPVTPSQFKSIEKFAASTGTLKRRFGMLPMTHFFRHGDLCVGFSSAHVWVAGEYD